MKVKLTLKSEATSMFIPQNKLDYMVYTSVQGQKTKIYLEVTQSQLKKKDIRGCILDFLPFWSNLLLQLFLKLVITIYLPSGQYVLLARLIISLKAFSELFIASEQQVKWSSSPHSSCLSIHHYFPP